MALCLASEPASLVQQKCQQYRALKQLLTPDVDDDAVDLIWRKSTEALSEAIAARSVSLADLHLKIGVLLDSLDEAETEIRCLLTMLQTDVGQFRMPGNL